MKTEALLAAGLTSNEAKVYLALLKMQSGTANEITKKTGVHRVNVYDILNRLTEKGLASHIIEKSKKVYQSVNPEVLQEMLKEKEFLIQKALPSLLADYQKEGRNQEVYFFNGPDGVYTAYMMMAQQKKTLYGIGGSGKMRTFLKHRHEKFVHQLKKQKTKVKALYYEHTRKTKAARGYDAKYLPDKYQNPMMIDVCGDLTVILLATDTASAIVIDNPILADSYRTYFELLWNTIAKR